MPRIWFLVWDILCRARCGANMGTAMVSLCDRSFVHNTLRRSFHYAVGCVDCFRCSNPADWYMDHSHDVVVESLVSDVRSCRGGAGDLPGDTSSAVPQLARGGPPRLEGWDTLQSGCSVQGVGRECMRGHVRWDEPIRLS